MSSTVPAMPRGVLLYEIDRATDGSRARVNGVGTRHELELLEIERVRATVLRAVAHAVRRDVVGSGVAAKVDAIPVAATTLAGREGDARQRRKQRPASSADFAAP